jgi:hypothetical protein
VFIDGISQLQSPHTLQKPSAFQSVPKVPDFTKEARDAVKYDGLPPLVVKNVSSDLVFFTNVKSVYGRVAHGVKELFLADESESIGVVLVRSGSIVCSGMFESCASFADLSDAQMVDLHGGSISPGLLSFGSPLGLQEIEQEPSTNDGVVFDPLLVQTPKIYGGDIPVVRAVDGLSFLSRDALYVLR